MVFTILSGGPGFLHLDIDVHLEYAEIPLALSLGLCHLAGSDRNSLFKNPLPGPCHRLLSLKNLAHIDIRVVTARCFSPMTGGLLEGLCLPRPTSTQQNLRRQAMHVR